MEMTRKDIKEMDILIGFLKRERSKVPSFSDFRARLRNYGYCIRHDEGGHFVHILPSREKLCPVPKELFA